MVMDCIKSLPEYAGLVSRSGAWLMHQPEANQQIAKAHEELAAEEAGTQ